MNNIFSTSMPLQKALEASDVLTGNMNFSKSVDSATLRAALSNVTNLPNQGKEIIMPIEDDMISLAMTIEEEDELKQVTAIRKAQIHMLSLPNTDIIMNGETRARSSSMGGSSNTHTHHSPIPLTSLTARPSIVSMNEAIDSRTDLPSSEEPSKYQTIRQVRASNHSSKVSKSVATLKSHVAAADNNFSQIEVTSFGSSSGALNLPTIQASIQTVSADVDESNRGDINCDSPALSEMSDLEDTPPPTTNIIEHQTEYSENTIITKQLSPIPYDLLTIDISPIENNNSATSAIPQESSEQQLLQTNDNIRSISPLQWRKGEVIGEGTFGKVFKGLNEKTGELLAIKQLCTIDGSDKDIILLEKEINIMWNLSHEYIVRYAITTYHFFNICATVLINYPSYYRYIGCTRSDRYLYIILEYVTGDSVAGMLKQYGEFSEHMIK